jgi:hypothetical protein
MNLGVGLRLGLGWLGEAVLWLGKNSRAPKRANHGARPCSSVMRRLRRREVFRNKEQHKGQDGAFENL